MRAADILAYAYIFAKEEEIEAQDSEGKEPSLMTIIIFTGIRESS